MYRVRENVVDVALHNDIDYSELENWVKLEAGESMTKGYKRFIDEKNEALD